MKARALTAACVLTVGCATAPPIEHPALEIELPVEWTSNDLPEGQRRSCANPLPHVALQNVDEVLP